MYGVQFDIMDVQEEAIKSGKQK